MRYFSNRYSIRFSVFFLTSVFAICINTNTIFAAVWHSQEQWTPEWENKYSEWVKKNWQKNIFLEPEKFYSNLSLDCADTVYAMRMIFSAENSLPFVLRDPTSHKNFVSNEMSRWDELPEIQRKREFLLFIFNIASTASIPNDTFPISIDRNSIRPGTLLLTDPAKHHSWTIKEILNTGIPFLLFSSRPAKTQLLERKDIPSTPFLFPKGLRPETNAGFRAFRNPADVKKAVWEIPGYSLEQYQYPITSWRRIVQEKLALQSETAEQRVERLLEEACKGARERIEVVQSALNALAKIGARCMNPEEYDNYSTPNRDQRMQDTFIDLNEAIKFLGDRANNPILLEKIRSYLSSEAEAYRDDDFCLVEVSASLKLSLAEVSRRSINNLFSNNPHDPLEMRWGYKKGHSSRALNCLEY